MDFGNLTPEQANIASQIADEARAQGVDPELALAVGWVENHFKPKGISNKGAIGPMQVMPANAKGLNMEPADLHDPQKNIQAGVTILRQNLNSFGNTRAALAAYNGRAELAKSYLEKGEDFNVLRPETRDYLEKIDALRNTDQSGLLASADNPKTKQFDFGELPAGAKEVGPSAPAPAQQEKPVPFFGEIDPNKAMELATKKENEPPPPPQEKPILDRIGDTAKEGATSAYNFAKENPELAVGAGAGAAAGYQLGKYGADTLDKQTAALEGAKTKLKGVQAGELEGINQSKTLAGDAKTALDELDATLAQRKMSLAQHEETLRRLQAELAEHAPTELKGAQKWTSTMGGEDVPLAQKMQAENMRANNPKGGQAIIDANTAAKQKLAAMGETGYSLTEPKPGQLAVPDEIAAERQAKALAEQQARNKAALEAQQKAEEARRQVEEAQRLRDRAEKTHYGRTQDTLTRQADAAKNVTKAEAEMADLAGKAPGPIGKAGVFASKVAGKTIGVLGGLSVPLAANEAMNRYNSGDTSGAIISGIEAASAALAMLPPGTPITAALKAVGIGGGLAAAVLDHFHTKPAAPAPKPAPKAPSGALSQYQEKKPSGIYKDAYGRYHG